MSSKNTFVRSLHDLGAAAWFGGTLMGAIGVNGAAASVRDPRDRARVATIGWGKWAPVNAVAIAAHLVGGGALLYANRGRAKHQAGVTANTVLKTLLTGTALGATIASGALGAKMTQAEGHTTEGATAPSSSTPAEVADAQRQLRYIQWALPALTGAIVVLGAQQGEQQRPSQIASGLGSTIARRASHYNFRAPAPRT